MDAGLEGIAEFKRSFKPAWNSPTSKSATGIFFLTFIIAQAFGA